MSIPVLTIMGCKSSKNLSNENSGVNFFQENTKNKTTLLLTKQESNQRQILLSIDSTGKIKVLAGQPIIPEFAKNIELDSATKVKGNIDIITLLKQQSELARLNNKSANLSTTQEALYRLAEAYFNGLVDSTKYSLLYSKIIDQSADIIATEIELEEAKAETILAEVEKAKIELQKAQLEFEKLKFENRVQTEKAKTEEEQKEDE